MQQHQSWFSYNIVRPYPFRWFSWVALLGGIAAAILFSVLNLAATGYNLQTIYTTDPNATLHEDYWFTKAPWSWTAKMRSSCQAQNIPVGYEFFTRNLGFSYTLESVSGYEEGSNTITSYPSLPYLNQNLDNCTIASVEIDLSKRDQTQNGYSAWWSWPGTGKVTATCTVSTGGGIYNATFSTECGSAQHHYDYVIQANATHLSSMWWATRLLNMYWNGLLTGVAQSLYPSDDGNWTTTPIWMTYSMTLTPNRTEDITKYNFFGLEYYIIAANADLFNFVQYPLSTMYDNHDTLPFSVALTQGLGWSKVAHSAILTDLGQKQGQNLLTNETLLQWALNHPTDTFRNDPDNVLNCSTKTCNYYWDFWAGIAPPSVLKAEDKDYVVANESYNAFKDSMGPLGTFDTTIFSQYACSVPVRKDGGTLFLSILVADLVFLNAAWVLLQWVATAIVARGNGGGKADAMMCEGCRMPYGLVSGNGGGDGVDGAAAAAVVGQEREHGGGVEGMMKRKIWGRGMSRGVSTESMEPLAGREGGSKPVALTNLTLLDDGRNSPSQQMGIGHFHDHDHDLGTVRTAYDHV